jgi:HK97 family phage portal protein
MTALLPRAQSGDVIALTNEKAGALVLSQNIADLTFADNDPIRTYALFDAARTVETFVAQNIALIPFDVYRKKPDGSREKISAGENDQVADMLEEPTLQMGFVRWAEALLLDYRIHDRWAAVKVISDDGRLELIRIPAAWCSFSLDSLRRIDALVIRRGGEERAIPIEHVVFDVGYDPYSRGRTRGFPLSQTMRASINELEKGSEYRNALLSGGPKVPMYITRPANAPAWVGKTINGTLAREKFLKEFQEFSAERAGQVPILEDGMELKDAPQLDEQSVKYKELRLAAQIEYCIANRIPPELLGYRQGTNSNIESLKEQLYTSVLQFDIVAFRQALQVGLRPLLEKNAYIEENLAARLASSPEKQAIVLQTQVGAPVRSRNEARRMLNLPPIEGGDELITPMNVTVGGLASPRDTAPDPADPPAEIPPVKSAYELASKMLEEQAKAATPGVAANPQRVSKFAEALRVFFFGQKKQALDVFGKGSTPGGTLDEAFPLEQHNVTLADLIYRHSYAFAQAGVSEVNDAFNLGADGFDAERMLPWLQKASLGTARAINRSQFGDLAVAMFGEEWQTEVSAVFDGWGGKAEEVARSTGKTSTEFGKMDRAKAAGLVSKQWKTHSKNSRHAHQDGEVVAIGETFSNGARYPGDPSLPIGERADCACTVTFSKEAPTLVI